ncbi:MAG: 16S rRNA (cytosine(1402)-N(4))-methyltransferase RsmH [Candidatus Doudnabacteria bacterium]
MSFHIPVLINETLEYLKPQPGQIIVDGTLGGAGHTLQLARAIQPNGTLIGIDLDPAALAEAKKNVHIANLTTKIILVRGNYKDIKEIINQEGVTKVDGILIDIGISSYDLEGSERGFSFQRKEPLDMRFDPEATPHNKNKDPYTAKYILNHFQEHELKAMFEEYSEDKFSGRIARGIVTDRQIKEFEYTEELFETIKKSLPAKFRFKAGDSARRIFQALRIEVNHELENLQKFLPEAFDSLSPAGRLAVISFHSLEDRIVKRFFLEKALGCTCPPDFPICQCGKTPLGKILTKKPVTASQGELQQNSRSAPAKLRVIQKL